MQNKPRRKSGYRLVQPPESFMNDIRYEVRNSMALARRTGLSERTARHLLAGDSLYEPDLKAAMDTFYGRSGEASMLSVQMGLMCSGSRAARSLYALLKTAAAVVQEYGDRLYVSRKAREYWVFPPRCEIVKLVRAVEECRAMLYRLHTECPEYDRFVFRDTPGLLAEFRQLEAEHGSSGIHGKGMRQVRPGRKERVTGAEKG